MGCGGGEVGRFWLFLEVQGFRIFRSLEVLERELFKDGSKTSRWRCQVG